MNRYIYFLTLIISFFLVSCDNNYSYNKEKEKTKFKIIDLSYVNNEYDDILEGNFEHNEYSYVNSRINTSIAESKYRISNFKHLLLDTNNDFEMEFIHNIYDGKLVKSISKKSKEVNGYNYFVGFNNRNQDGYLIGWRNIVNSGEKISWEIGIHTDSIISTLSYTTIKNMFPSFKGNFTQVKVDSIVIPYFSDMEQTLHYPKYIYLQYARVFGNHKWFKYMNYFDIFDLMRNRRKYILEEKHKNKERKLLNIVL